MPKIYAICEGPGEKEAVPNIVTRILQHLGIYDVFVGGVQLANGKGALTRDGGIERFVERAQMEDCDGLLILLDADEECPIERALDFAARLEGFGEKCPIAIVLAHCAFENWFLASLETLRGKDFGDGRPGLKADSPLIDNCEGIRGAKDRLTHLFPRSIAYKETIDQICLSRLVDIDLTRQRSRSFRRLCDAVQCLATQIERGEKGITPSLGPLRERLVPIVDPPAMRAKSRRRPSAPGATR